MIFEKNISSCGQYIREISLIVISSNFNITNTFQLSVFVKMRR